MFVTAAAQGSQEPCGDCPLPRCSTGLHAWREDAITNKLLTAMSITIN